MNWKKWYRECSLCPRECGVNRLNGRKGFCGQTASLKVARAALHMWEEPCISGTNGSGTVFFSGCHLGCVFCQNGQISRGSNGKEISIIRLAQIFMELQEKGAHNINLVTPTHFVPQIIEALRISRKMGLHLPIVYNTGGFEKLDTLQMLDGWVDVYLTDFKFMDLHLARRYANEEGYSFYAAKALEEMYRQTGEPVFDEDGMMTKGIIVRHMVLPGQAMDSRRIIDYIYDTYGDKVFLSLMNQYTPSGNLEKYPELKVKVKTKVYERLIDYTLRKGVENAFIQEGQTAKESFIPDFDGEGV
ncbi:MAG: radical SAM protein [Lachnospiraceae bacterium]|nr:radical SAM protein [Lachnospiraceae bacterium]